MKCNEIQEQEEIKLQLISEKKVQKLKEKGITLIALVVTIIILLILAGVTLNMALSGDGLFSRARNAADKYKKAQEDEQELISEIGKEMNSEYVGAKVIGYNPTQGSIAITAEESGTEYQSFKTEKIEWRIWDYDGTILRLISDKPTTQTLKLNGAAGYNNGVWAINEICRKCYSNESLGAIAINLRRSDIQKVSAYDYTKYSHEPGGHFEATNDNEENVEFGEAIPYTTNQRYPRLWEINDSNWKYEYRKEGSNVEDKECLIWESEERADGVSSGDDNKVFKQSYYACNFIDRKSLLINPKYYDLILSNVGETSLNSYWLSTRRVNIGEGSCDFGMCGVGKDIEFIGITGVMFFKSSDGTENKSEVVIKERLRPVVSINVKEYDIALERAEVDDEVCYKIVTAS